MELVFYNTYGAVLAAPASSFYCVICMVANIKAMVAEPKLA